MNSPLKKTLVTAIVSVAALVSAQTANAAFKLMLDDPNDSAAAIVVEDTLNTGFLSYNGAVGSFNVNVTTGVSDPIVGPGILDLNSINVSSGAPGTLLISLTDTDYTGTAPAYAASFGGTTFGSVDFSFEHDASNQEFGGTAFAAGNFTFAGTPSFSDDLVGGVAAGSPYSLTINAEITHDTAGDLTSFDAVVSPVPVPAAAWLFGSALLGLAGLGRNRKRAA